MVELPADTRARFLYALWTILGLSKLFQSRPPPLAAVNSCILPFKIAPSFRITLHKPEPTTWLTKLKNLEQPFRSTA